MKPDDDPNYQDDEVSGGFLVPEGFDPDAEPVPISIPIPNTNWHEWIEHCNDCSQCREFFEDGRPSSVCEVGYPIWVKAGRPLPAKRNRTRIHEDSTWDQPPALPGHCGDPIGEFTEVSETDRALFIRGKIWDMDELERQEPDNPQNALFITICGILMALFHLCLWLLFG